MGKKALSILLAAAVILCTGAPFARAADGAAERFCPVPVSTVPESGAADPAWFSNACLIGHSQAEGMRDHMDLPQMDYYALNGLKASQALEIGIFPLPGGGMGSLRGGLSSRTYDHVFILLGVNDCTKYESGPENFRTAMIGILNTVRETQPQADICLLSLLPVGRSTPDPLRYNRENVILYSQVLKSLSREYDTEYLDLFRPMADEEGYLDERCDSGDGIHLRVDQYEKLKEFFLTHTW